MTEAPTGDTARGTRLSVIVLVAVTVVASLTAIVAILVGHHRSGSWLNAGDDATVPGAAERSRAAAAAEQFCLRVDGFDGDDPDAYKKSVIELLTTKYRKDFETEFAQVEKLGIQKGYRGKGKILASGVSDIDTDSATVLVAHDNTITSAEGTGQQHFRWTVSLDKVQGRWLVDDYTPVS